VVPKRNHFNFKDLAMAKENQEVIERFLTSISEMKSESLMELVEDHLSDEGIELFVDHLESFYGVEDDEELGTLAQIMVTGYLCAKAELKIH
jgi:hypothetical protein